MSSAPAVVVDTSSPDPRSQEPSADASDPRPEAYQGRTSKPLPAIPVRTVSFADEPEYEPSEDGYDVETHTEREYRAPKYVHIIYRLSCVLSIFSLLILGAAWYIARHVPFTDDWKDQKERESNWLGILPLMCILGTNIVWTNWNIGLARRGRYFNLLVLNSIYDFLMWAAFLAFAILTYIFELWDRDGQCSAKELQDRRRECEYFSESIMLPLNLTGAGLALLLGVLHFILLIARCSLDVPRYFEVEKPFVSQEERLELLGRRRNVWGEGRNVRHEENAVVVQSLGSQNNGEEEQEEGLIQL